jgi:hypothetical protein
MRPMPPSPHAPRVTGLSELGASSLWSAAADSVTWESCGTPTNPSHKRLDQIALCASTTPRRDENLAVRAQCELMGSKGVGSTRKRPRGSHVVRVRCVRLSGRQDPPAESN